MRLERILPPKVYGIADRDALGGRDIPDAVEAMATAGIEWIQIRAKSAGGGQLAQWIETSIRRLEGSGVGLWINDRVDLAALYPVVGVHLGQDDLPPEAARRLLPREVRIGLSNHGPEQLLAAERAMEVDVVAIGPIFATRSKSNPDPVVGLAGLADLRRLIRKPMVAIGGIDRHNVGRVLATGVDTVAVIGALSQGDVEQSCKQFLKAVEEAT